MQEFMKVGAASHEAVPLPAKAKPFFELILTPLNIRLKDIFP